MCYKPYVLIYTQSANSDQFIHIEFNRCNYEIIYTSINSCRVIPQIAPYINLVW